MYGLNESGLGLKHQPCTCIGFVVLSIQCSLWVACAFAVVLGNVITIASQEIFIIMICYSLLWKPI